MGAVFMIQCPVMTALLPGGYILQRSVKLLYSGYSSRIGQPEGAPHDIILDNLRSPQEKGRSVRIELCSGIEIFINAPSKPSRTSIVTSNRLPNRQRDSIVDTVTNTSPIRVLRLHLLCTRPLVLYARHTVAFGLLSSARTGSRSMYGVCIRSIYIYSRNSVQIYI